MRKIITRIKNFLFLRKVLKGSIDMSKLNYYNAVKVGSYFYKSFKKGCCERNLFAAFVKKYRKDNPYNIKGWSDNERLYKEYDKMEGAIKSLQEVKEKKQYKDVYVTMFRDSSYYKGDTPFKYHLVGTILKKPVTYKVGEFRKSTQSFLLGDNCFINLNEEWIRAFRYATEEEISAYKAKEIHRSEVQKEIDAKQKELSELYKKLNS